MMDEHLAALNLLFTEARCSFTGKYFAFENIEMAPKGLRQPFPLYIGSHNVEAIERTARHDQGHGWLGGWRPLHGMAHDDCSPRGCLPLLPACAAPSCPRQPRRRHGASAAAVMAYALLSPGHRSIHRVIREAMTQLLVSAGLPTGMKA
ncbi:MAG TPA: hypothetical protein VGC09_05190 [Rhodopila sp.]